MLARATERELLTLLDSRLRWLSAWIIHNANHLRESTDALKVGGHQASCASISTIMTALYFHGLRANDKVAVKPHAGPVLHAIHYMLGTQSRDQLENFRGFGGMQSYPSRTKDSIPVDFSTGSVGLGVAITAFASLVQDYLLAHDMMAPSDSGRMIALMGDAELDEGNIYECLIEAYKHDIRNCWWIVDYNRQSLDATTAERMFRQFDEIFASCGWRVVTLKYGRKLAAAFEEEGGVALRTWIDEASNADYAALTYLGGAAWRERLLKDVPQVKPILDARDDDELAAIMTNLGGHDMEALTTAFDSAQDDVPTLFIAYTIKGYGLPFAGHKDNHAGLMNPGQIAALREKMGLAEGEEWEPYAGLGSNSAEALKQLVGESGFAQKRPEHEAPRINVPPIQAPTGAEQSTQAAFGKILLELAKATEGDAASLASHIVTTSPDVTVSTNLGAWVNQRGLFRRSELADVFRLAKIPSAQKWAGHGAGQHIELGIAESNLFLMLAAAGLAGPLFGTRLLPIGTVYDPFIARGLDQLNYGCYQDARFILVATPSGLTLGPEGGAHQSINTPLIGMGQSGLTSFEPAFVDELAACMEWAFEHIQEADGGSVYLRLSTRTLLQPGVRTDPGWRADMLKGAYWLKQPKGVHAIAYMGALAPEAIEAWGNLAGDRADLGLLAITSPDLLHRDWSSAQARRARGETVGDCHIERMLAPLGRDGQIVGVVDGSPSCLTWLGGVHGQKVHGLGVDRFGQTGTLQDLYAEYGLDADSIQRAAQFTFTRSNRTWA